MTQKRVIGIFIEVRILVFVNAAMGLIRLRVREFAQERSWTLKEVSNRSGVPYTTIATYAKSAGMATVDYTALHKMARVFGVSIEDLVEIVEE
ncbi:MAG TPA: helix-turn-helix transcriptional regulator [Coleofasciculaceae cyanobacterium]